MKIVITLTDSENREMIVGPFVNADEARSWAQDHTNRRKPLAPLGWKVSTLAEPDEWVGLYG